MRVDFIMKWLINLNCIYGTLARVIMQVLCKATNITTEAPTAQL
jgi:hypothetical protein